MSSKTKTAEIVYKSVGFDDFPPLVAAAAGDFVFNHSPVPLDDGPAYIDSQSGTILTRAQTYDLALRLAKGVDLLGYRRGKGVAMVFCPNSLAWPIVFLGLQSNSVLTTLANVSYTTNELAHQIKDSGATLFFVGPTVFHTLLATLKLLGYSEAEMRKHIIIMSYVPKDMDEEHAQGIDASWTRLHDMLKRGKLTAPVRLSGRATDEPILLCYSGGTTGRSKGVMTTHRNLVSIPQTYRPLAFPIDRSKDVEMGFLPLYHNYGIIKVLFFGFWIGVPIVIVPKFEPVSFFQTIAKYKISIIRLVPPVLVTLATHPEFDKHDLSSMKYMQSGAAPLGRGLLERVKERFHKQGANVTIIQGYGLTETSTTSHMLPLKDELRKIGSAGVMIPTMEARIVDDDEKDVPPGKGIAGELWMRGPTVMKGYLNNPTATKNSITKDGWFKSGDIAIRDDEGYFYIVDRKKELIKYKGFQVPPADLEAVLLTKEDIADCGVIGIDSVEQATELPRAYVVSTNNAHLLANPAARRAFEADVEEWIKSQVARHKWLRGGVQVIEAIPKSASGKILRRELREFAKKETQSKAPVAKSKL
ncbi:AMP binding protein [Clavulina sp. PMI_390]|nr:AMP binding protein [Clavulina sp. PMI_390]